MTALEAGAALPPQEYLIRRADLVAYAAASGDHNPIHQDEAIAQLVGLPGVIAHGMYTMALAARAVATWTDDAEVVELGCKFTSTGRRARRGRRDGAGRGRRQGRRRRPRDHRARGHLRWREGARRPQGGRSD